MFFFESEGHFRSRGVTGRPTDHAGAPRLVNFVLCLGQGGGSLPDGRSRLLVLWMRGDAGTCSVDRAFRKPWVRGPLETPGSETNTLTTFSANADKALCHLQRTMQIRTINDALGSHRSTRSCSGDVYLNATPIASR